MDIITTVTDQFGDRFKLIAIETHKQSIMTNFGNWDLSICLNCFISKKLHVQRECLGGCINMPLIPVLTRMK